MHGLPEIQYTQFTDSGQCTEYILDLCIPHRGYDVGWAHPELYTVHLFGVWVGTLNVLKQCLNVSVLCTNGLGGGTRFTAGVGRSSSYRHIPLFYNLAYPASARPSW